jgi:hypothetical protein
MRALTQAEGLSRKVLFNCASLGAGEVILPDHTQEDKVDPVQLDALRRWHQREKAALLADTTFQVSCDFRETLKTLRGGWSYPVSRLGRPNTRFGTQS